MKALWNLLLNTVIIFLMSYFGMGLSVTSFWCAVFVALTFGALNFIGAITLVIVPFMLLSFFGLIIYEGLLLWITSLIIPGFDITNFWWALLAAIILGIVNTLFKSR